MGTRCGPANSNRAMRLRLGSLRSWGLPAALLLALAAPNPALAQAMQLPVPVGMGGDPAAQIVLAGNAAFLRGDLAGAARSYRAALARKPDFAIATFNLGLVEMHRGQSANGMRDMDRGISLARRHAMSSRDIARLRALRAAFAPGTAST